MPDAADVPADDGSAFPHRLGTVRPKPSQVDFCRTTAADRCSAFTSVGSSAARMMMPSSAASLICSSIYPALRIVGSIVAEEHERAVDLLARLAEGVNDAHQGPSIGRTWKSASPADDLSEFCSCQEFPYLPVGQLAVLRRKRVDRRRDELLADAEMLAIFGQREDAPSYCSMNWRR